MEEKINDIIAQNILEQEKLLSNVGEATSEKLESIFKQLDENQQKVEASIQAIHDEIVESIEKETAEREAQLLADIESEDKRAQAEIEEADKNAEDTIKEIEDSKDEVDEIDEVNPIEAEIKFLSEEAEDAEFIVKRYNKSNANKNGFSTTEIYHYLGGEDKPSEKVMAEYIISKL